MPITPFVPPSFVSSLPSAIWSGVGGLPVLPFLPGQSITVSKAPKWSTEVIKSVSGRRRTTAYWPFPLWQFELQYEVIRHRPTRAELVAMWEFFNVAQGQAGVWLFVDPSDCQVPSCVVLDSVGAPVLDGAGHFVTDSSGLPIGFPLGTGDGSTRTFTLQRPMGSWAEPIYAGYQASVSDNGNPAGASTVSGSQLTFTTPPAAGHTLLWFGFFYFGCAFLQDDLTFEQLVYGLWSGKSLKFESVRP